MQTSKGVGGTSLINKLSVGPIINSNRLRNGDQYEGGNISAYQKVDRLKGVSILIPVGVDIV